MYNIKFITKIPQNVGLSMMCYKKRLKEFTEIDKRVDVVNGSFPIKRTHREFIVVTVMHL